MNLMPQCACDIFGKMSHKISQLLKCFQKNCHLSVTFTPKLAGGFRPIVISSAELKAKSNDVHF